MIDSLLQSARQQLTTAGYDAGEADILLAHILGQDKNYLYGHPEANVSQEHQELFKQMLTKRGEGTPIAYITGQKEFYGRTFLVNADVLIPRPDSEILIETALRLLEGKKEADILDIGTGSGCLIITLALETANRFHYLGTDISLPALAVARENADRLQAQVSLLPSDLLNSLPEKKYDLIIANLPYLSAEQMSEPSIQHEPPMALFGGEEGLFYYHKLLQQVPQFLKPQGILLLEIDPAQEITLTQMIKSLQTHWQLEFIKDLSGRTRVVKVVIATSSDEAI